MSAAQLPATPTRRSRDDEASSSSEWKTSPTSSRTLDASFTPSPSRHKSKGKVKGKDNALMERSSLKRISAQGDEYLLWNRVGGAGSASASRMAHSRRLSPHRDAFSDQDTEDVDGQRRRTRPLPPSSTAPTFRERKRLLSDTLRYCAQTKSYDVQTDGDSPTRAKRGKQASLLSPLSSSPHAHLSPTAAALRATPRRRTPCKAKIHPFFLPFSQRRAAVAAVTEDEPSRQQHVLRVVSHDEPESSHMAQRRGAAAAARWSDIMKTPQKKGYSSTAESRDGASGGARQKNLTAVVDTDSDDSMDWEGGAGMRPAWMATPGSDVSRTGLHSRQRHIHSVYTPPTSVSPLSSFSSSQQNGKTAVRSIVVSPTAKVAQNLGRLSRRSTHNSSAASGTSSVRFESAHPQVPLVARSLMTQTSASDLLYKMRTGGIGGLAGGLGRMGLHQGGRLGRLDITPYLGTFFSTSTTDCFEIPRGLGRRSAGGDREEEDGEEEDGSNYRGGPSSPSPHSDEENIPPVPSPQRAPSLGLHSALPISHPLCCAYSYSSRSANDLNQWLAVGTDEGRVTLVNTARDPDTGDALDAGVAADLPSARPSWRAADASVFILAWRFDDRVIGTGGSDYELRLWDTENCKMLGRFGSSFGSPRQLCWDPNGNGNLLCSGGRDGAVHLYDARVHTASELVQPHSFGGIFANRTGSHCATEAARKPVLSLWNVHTAKNRVFSTLGGVDPGQPGRKGPPKGVTAVAYVPGREHCIVTAGCEDARLKVWDFRAASQKVVAAAEVELVSGGGGKQTLSSNSFSTKRSATWQPTDEAEDLSSRDGFNKSPHGVSSLVTSGDRLFAACTDGRIYSTPTASLLQRLTITQGSGTPLYSAAQGHNTLYAKMALNDDDRLLAVGCNTGDIMLWDVARDGLVPYSGVQLTGGHAQDFEVNGVSWASGIQGTTLASISDDLTVRCWRADRQKLRKLQREEAERQEGMNIAL